MVDAARRDVLALDAEDPAYDAAVAQLLEAEAAQLATGAPRSAAQRDRSWFRRSARQRRRHRRGGADTALANR